MLRKKSQDSNETIYLNKKSCGRVLYFQLFESSDAKLKQSLLNS